MVMGKDQNRVLGKRLKRKEIGAGEPFEGITCWTGEPGSGKTFALGEVGLIMYKMGWDVFSNGMNLPFEAGSYHDFSALTAMLETTRRNRTLILLDEAPMWANSREWKNFPSGLFNKLQQVRKYGFWLHYSAINFEKVDLHLRDQTYWIWLVSKAMITRRFIRRLTVPEELQVAWERPRLKYKIWARREVADAFDTAGKIATPGSRIGTTAGEQYDIQVCQTCGTLWLYTGGRFVMDKSSGVGCYDCALGT